MYESMTMQFPTLVWTSFPHNINLFPHNHLIELNSAHKTVYMKTPAQEENKNVCTLVSEMSAFY